MYQEMRGEIRQQHWLRLSLLRRSIESAENPKLYYGSRLRLPIAANVTPMERLAEFGRHLVLAKLGGFNSLSDVLG